MCDELDQILLAHWRMKKPTRCHLIFYCTSYRLKIFRALLCLSSGTRDYDVDYNIGRFVLGLLYVGGYVRLGWSSVRAAGSSTTAKQERNDQCGNQHHSRELLMMGLVMLETFWAWKKYNKIISGIKLVFYSSVITMMHAPIKITFTGSVYISLAGCYKLDYVSFL